MRWLLPAVAGVCVLLAGCGPARATPDPTPPPDKPRYTERDVMAAAFAKDFPCMRWDYSGDGMWECEGNRIWRFDERTGRFLGHPLHD